MLQDRAGRHDPRFSTLERGGTVEVFAERAL
jgi:hypothetical protein